MFSPYSFHNLYYAAIGVLLVLPTVFGAEQAESISLRLEVGTSESVVVPSMATAVASNGKVVRVRQVDAKTLVVTARAVGRSTLRIWDAEGKIHIYQVEVFQAGRLATAAQAGLGVVRVSLQIVEVFDQNRKELGIHWPEMLDFKAGVQWTGSGQGDVDLHFPQASGWLRHLLQNGWGRVVSQPDLWVVLGEQAQFSSGGELPYPVVTESYGRIEHSVHWKNYGLSLKVRPESADQFIIRSEIVVDISDITGQSGVKNVPALSKRSVSTKIHSKDGETVFLSGLFRNATTESGNALPLLAEVPVLGIFFQQKNQTRDSNEVIVAMTLKLKTAADGREQVEQLERLKQRQAR